MRVAPLHVATQTDPFQAILDTTVVNNDDTVMTVQLIPSMDRPITPAPALVSCPPAIHKEPFVATEVHEPVMNPASDDASVQLIPSEEYIPILVESLL